MTTHKGTQKTQLTEREMRQQVYIEIILRAIDGGTTVSVAQLARMTTLELDHVRRLCDLLVERKVLGKKTFDFWNGMHYATRNLYFLLEDI